ncbi:translation initiation factor IF-2 [Treponema sp. JC4]|uniref:translation initiation factor IF-2 n=1 Tax=Treponema sp. JC4 TaxID=1124982 RepID=UPI00025B070B|nr:translation initiation factor IF-2 [Treponema sp. JC4]EID85435.1 translation initiation factor IF-2 [Treponema sp. JC4]
MAEESEKKPGFVVHKKAQTQPAASAPAAPEKKRVVVVRKNPAQNAPQDPSKNDGAKKSPVKVVVKKAEGQAPAQTEKPAKPLSQAPAAAAEAPKPANTQQAQRPRTFELNQARPNVKAGNLSDHGRQNNRGGYNRGGNGQGGYNNYNRGQGGQGGYNRNGGNGGQGGFNGAQARQSYQNRERDNREGGQGFNRGGQGGFNRGGQGGQGGFNRGGQGGFNRPGQGGQGGFRPRPMGGGMAPASPIPEQRTQGKKAAYKGKKQVYNRKDEEQYDDNLFEQKKKVETPASVVPKEIEIMETVSVSDLARKMNLKASEVIGKLMGMGVMVTITQSIDHETAELLASEYGCEVKLVSLYDETVIESDKDDGVELLPRPPIVTVMGHVDHGKTKTLDAIRHANVAAGEAGGITQSIGAYSVTTEKGKITFLDTPGHEAFTMMRARGAQVTDIVVLVVAADDGVMPQTLEAIAHAKDAKVPIIVAVNKVDKPEANPDRVKTQLSELGLTPEEWGGDTQYVHISALKKEGIDDLLDAILLQAEMLELKANFECRAEGKILESRVDQGRGVVSTVIVQRGSLKQGDPFVAGIYSGRVRAMFDDRGKRIQEAGPSIPVEVLGMEEMPNAGDPFQVTESEKDARAISAKRQELKRFEAAKAVKKTTLDTLYKDIENSEVKELKVIIKADLQGSAEALKASLEKLSTREIRLSVIHSSAGAINESDVTLASADENAIIIGFNVRPTPKAKTLAEQEQVEIRKYNIIYKCVEEIQAAMEGMLQPDTKEEVIGMVEVRNTFRVPKVGVIAGCMVSEGVVKRTASVHLVRDGIVKFTGKITSLKRFKDDAKEVSTGYECGIGLENWQDIMVGDKLEVFEIVEVAKKLGKTLAEEEAELEKKGGADTDKEGENS